ncbi:hypothetical protein Hanom_Chr10g00912001 [Helianthus anomalus]
MAHGDMISWMSPTLNLEVDFDDLAAPIHITMDESHKILMEVVGNLHTSTSNENEILKKEVEALRADKEIKDEQLNMLYIVIENKLGINVQAVYDEIEIQRVEARRREREKRLAEEVVKALEDKKKGPLVA